MDGKEELTMRRRCVLVARVVLAASLAMLMLPAGFAQAASSAVADAAAANADAAWTGDTGAGGAGVGDVASGEGASDGVRSASAVDGAEYAKDEIIVVYDADVTAQEERHVDDVASAKAMSSASELSDAVAPSENLGRAVKMQVDEDKADELIDELNATPGVACAQHNFIYRLVDETVQVDEGADGAATVSSEDAGADVDADADLTVTSTAGVQSQASPAADEAPSWAIPNDTKLSSQYYLDPWEKTTSTSGANLYNAWTLARTEQSVSIAILDTGVKTDHEDLKANIDTEHMASLTQNSDGSVTVAKGEMSMTDGHGTHVAGIAAGAANNGKGIAGTSWNARIVPLQVFYYETSFYSSDLVTDSAMLLAAYQYLKELIDAGELSDLHVINMSLGGYGEDDQDTAFQKAIRTMRDDYKVLTVVAGGNGEYGKALTDKSWPGDFDECMSVTALNQNGTNATFSDYNEYKDISAPGVGIYSTYNKSTRSYESLSGTSMACPLVAGIAALLWTVQPDLTVAQAFEAMQKTAHALDPDGANYHDATQTGSAGAIDAYEAVKYVIDKFGGEANVDDPTRPIYLTDECVTLEADTAIYYGTPVTPAVTVVAEGTTLVEGTDYTLTYTDNDGVGTATATVEGLGRYVGTVSKTFTIEPKPTKPITASDVTISGDTTYTGAAVTPAVSVRVDGTTLVEGTDYTLDWSDNVEVGTAHVVVTGIDNYRDSVDATFSVGKAAVAWKRLAGGTALSTMRKISTEGFSSSRYAVIASSQGYWDALSASALAGVYECPILLTSPNSLSWDAESEVLRLGVQRAFIVGGMSAVSQNVQDYLENLGTAVTRIAGNTAVGTSLAVYDFAKDKWGGDAIVASSASYHDALSAAPYAYAKKAPIGLVRGSDKKLSAKGVRALQDASVERVVVVGGTAAVAGAVESSQLAGKSCVRLGGATAYGTSKLVANWCIGQGMSADKAGIATGKSYYDALTGAALCGKNNAVLCLVDEGKEACVSGVLVKNKNKMLSAYVFGGTAAVSDVVEKACEDAVK